MNQPLSTDTERLSMASALVGEVTAQQLRHIDYVVTARVGVFLPVTGPCDIARTPSHSHPSYSFVVAFDDRSRVSVGDRIISLRAGMLVAFSPAVAHDELPMDGPPRYAAICVEPRFFEAIAQSHPAVRGRLLRGAEAPASFLVGCVRRLVAEHESKLPGSTEIIAARETELVHLLMRALAATDPVVADPEATDSATRQVSSRPALEDRLRVDAALQFVHARFHEHVTVADMARAAHMSQAHFSREWKREVGVSPMEYVMNLRLDAARRRLIVGDEPLTAIAIECGFGSSSYFSYCFNRRFGLPPSEYRRCHGR